MPSSYLAHKLILTSFGNFHCRLLGTPNEEMWPGVSRLKNWHEYPQWKPQQLSSAVSHLDENGLDLLNVSSLCILSIIFCGAAILLIQEYMYVHMYIG